MGSRRVAQKRPKIGSLSAETSIGPVCCSSSTSSSCVHERGLFPLLAGCLCLFAPPIGELPAAQQPATSGSKRGIPRGFWMLNAPPSSGYGVNSPIRRRGSLVGNTTTLVIAGETSTLSLLSSWKRSSLTRGVVCRKRDILSS